MFLYDRQGAISWSRALAVIVLFGLAVKTKEIAVSLAGILLLTDLLWGWLPFYSKALAATGGCTFDAAWRGPGQRDNPPYARDGAVGWVLGRELQVVSVCLHGSAGHLRVPPLAALPVGQSLDHDFAPSRTIAEHGAVVYIALLAVMVVIAILGGAAIR